jgi:Putative auto-transporter adhesin, head GIN domain
MKKQIILSLAFMAAMFTATAQQTPAAAKTDGKAEKKQKTKKQYRERSEDSNWSSNGWGGEAVVGTGDVITENRDLRDFTGVSSAIAADIEVRQSATFKVTLEGQKNILDLLETEVRDGRLKISFRKGYSMKYKKNIIIHVEAPNFAYLGMAGSGNVWAEGALTGEKLDISVSGSGDFNLKNLQYGDVKVNISGSGDINLGGTTERSEFVISGSGDLKATDLKAQSARCRISGSGNMNCHAAKEMDALVSGSGDIRYSGSPATIKKKVSGSGSIEAR